MRQCAPFSFFMPILILLTTGCMGTSQPVRFYRLTPMNTAESGNTQQNTGRSFSIGLGPIEMPDYLNRPQIVLNTPGNEMVISEFDRWAEPLQKNFSAVLVENLEALLPLQTVFEYPWPPSVKIDYRIILQIVRFEGNAEGNVELIARWMILEGRKQNLHRTGKTKIVEKSGPPRDYEAIVAAESRAVAALSREIVREIENL